MIYLTDPLCFKESILISLEVLSNDKYDQLKTWVESISNTIERSSLNTSKAIEEDLKKCIGEFKNTKTYFWLREDFKNVLIDIERQQSLDKKIS